MTPLVANTLVTLKCEDDAVLFRSMILTTREAVDHYVILDTSPDGPYNLAPKILEECGVIDKLTFLGGRGPDYINRVGFAEARNELLKASPEHCWLFWLDSDEVHLPSNLKLLWDYLPELEADGCNGITTHFIHFCLSSNFYEKFERRENIFLRYPETHWENKVHEKIKHGAVERNLFHSDYNYHHYGYARDQAYVFSRWYQYAELEGNKEPYKCEDEDGKTVPYFRGDRTGPDRILEDRRKVLCPYFGEYPSELPREWILMKRINI